jgi:hypothetical protein
MKVLIDTGIFVNVLNGESDSESSARLLKKVHNKQIQGVISTITLSEILSIFYRISERRTIKAKIYVEIIETHAIATTCLKEPLRPFSGGATVIDCESYPVPSTPVFVGSNCEEFNVFTHPQEMNTVTKGKIAKTVESQKEIFLCALDGGQVCIDAPPCASTVKKVEVILFTDVYEDLATQEIEEIQFHSMRCVVLISDEAFIGDPDKVLQDATVETCQFSSIEN